MDVRLYLRILWRWKYLIAAGLVIGCGLAALAVKSRSKSYRSHTTLFVTQPGFPWGRSAAATGSPLRGQPDNAQQGLGDPQRLATLTALYAKLAVADGIQHGLIARTTKEHESVSVAAVSAPPYSTPSVLPLLSIYATAGTPQRATALAKQATRSFMGWLQEQQTNAAIDDNSRIVVQIVNPASTPQQVGHHSKALPVMIALAVLAAFIGLAFVLQNVLPPERAAAPDANANAVPASRFAA